MKKSLIIILSVVGIILLGFGIWYFFFHKIPASSTSSVSSGSPFGTAPGNISSTGTGAGNSGAQTIGTTTPGTLPNLFEISNMPVAGAVVIVENKKEMIRYADRATGHIYDVDPTTMTKTEVVDDTLPKIYEADWKPDGSEVIFRSLPDDGDVIDNTSLALVAPKSTSTPMDSVSATELRGDITALATNANSIAYVLGDTGNIGISGFAGEKPQTVFSSDFKEWQIAWSGSSNLEVTTDASAGTPGFSYRLNIGSGSLTKLLGPLNALTALPNSDGSLVAYSYADNSGTTLLGVENVGSDTSSNLIPATFAEKCVWSIEQKNIIFCGAPTSAIDANEPDNWYQGVTHFSDQIWKFDAGSGLATLLVDPQKNFNVSLDVVHPMLSPNEDYLIFMNKTDLTLWALKLSSE